MEGNTNKYLRVLKLAQLSIQEACEICDLLEESTLDRITKIGVDRRIIKPLLMHASKKDAFGKVTDQTVNQLMNDMNFMSSLCKSYGVLV